MHCVQTALPYFMAHKFNQHTMIDGRYGPTPNGHYYQPAPYHNPSAQKRNDKTRWILNQSQQYEVFEIADTPLGGKTCWMNDDQSGLYGMLDSCNEILGKDNDERLAFFPKPSNQTDSWHGYPTDSDNLGDELIDFWHEQNLITDITYARLLRHQL